MGLLDGSPVRTKRRRARFLLVAGAALAVLASFHSARVDADVSSYEPLLNKKPETWHLTEARLHWDRGRIRQATELLVRALHENPANLEVVTWLADAYIRQEQFPEAIKLLSNHASHSTRTRNYYYRLGYSYGRRGDYRNALGYLTKAVEVDPYLLRGYLDIARVRRKQGFMHDAEEALKRALQISPGWKPAVDELKLVTERIQSNNFNIFRKNNMVVHFPDHSFMAKVEEFYPLMEAHRRNLEDKLKFHLPEVNVKVVHQIERHFSPPAFYDDLEDAVYLSEKALAVQDHVAFGHELTWMYVQRMTRKAAPIWLVEGLALLESRPSFIDETPLKTTQVKFADLDRFLAAEKRFLEFQKVHELGEEKVHSLVACYSVVRFLLESYGWPSMRAILGRIREGDTTFENIVPKVLHIDMETMEAKYAAYVMSRFYFSTIGELAPKLPVFEWPKQ